ncbi:MAG: amino acid permease [Clostridiales Family XIII bacterium]|jgi:lysine-specific permease|nr:amino acid permease [Clostridiales Family XIII bacterium]
MSENKEKLQRKLGPRQMNMIAIGGAIGTGLFVALGQSVGEAGPGGTLIAYGLVGIAVYFVMNALGEMSTHTPVPGAFETFGSRYVDESFGFMMGWNYWLCCAFTMGTELVASAIIMKFWFPESNSIMWSAIFLALILLLNLLSTKIYGESEFWFAGIKFVTIIIFLIVGILMIAGIINSPEAGFGNWTKGEAPFVGGGMATFSILMVAGFSFIGVEATAVAAGEAQNPDKTIPKAINNVFWRILIFYIGGIVVIGTLMPYDDPNLLAADIDNVAVSPFTLVFQHAGIKFAAHLMNAVILTSVLSCGNSTMYEASRILYSMSQQKRAPKVFGRLSKRHVPVLAVLLTSVISMMCFLTGPNGDSVVYTWLYNGTGLTGFITWLGVCYTHLRFRKAFQVQGHDLNELKFKARFYPFGTWFALIACIVVILGQAYWYVGFGEIDWQGLAIAFTGIPFALILWLAHKLSTKTKLIPYSEIVLKGGDEI